MSLQYINGRWVETNTAINGPAGLGNNSFSGISPVNTALQNNPYGIVLPQQTTQVNTGLNQNGQTLYSNVPTPPQSTVPPTNIQGNALVPTANAGNTSPGTPPAQQPLVNTAPPIVGTPTPAAFNPTNGQPLLQGQTVTWQGITYTGTTPATQTPTPTPTPVAPVGSAGSILNGYNPSGYTPDEQAIIDADNARMAANMNATFDPNAIYNQNLQMYQAQIDAINNIYNDQLNQSRIQNAPEFASRVGSQVAMAARGGLLGSDPGKAMVDNQVNANQKVQDASDAVARAEKNDALNRVYGKVTDSVTAAKKTFDDLKAKSTEEYIAGIKARPEERKKQTSAFIKALLAEGIDIADLTPEELEKFAKKIGVDAGALATEYSIQFSAQEAAQAEKQAKEDKAVLDARKIESDIAKSEADKLQTEKETSLLGQMTPYQRAQLEQSAKAQKLTGPEYLRTSAQEMGGIIDSSLDSNGFLTPSQYKQAKTKWVNESGLTPEQFDSYFSDKAYTKEVDKESPYTIQSYGISKKGTNALAVPAE